jgi:light-regulated signal transduction histidine kinase (bacteriophytochrome)
MTETENPLPDSENKTNSFENQEAKFLSLKRSHTELKEFAYSASHDLKEPLRKFTVFGEKLQLKYKDRLDKEGNLYLDRMMVAAGTMKKLIDSLMDFLFIQDDTEYFRKTDLNEVLQSVENDSRLTFEQTGSTLKAAPLPVIEAIPVQMKKLFSHLIDNAIKFRKPGVPPEIKISCGLAEQNELELRGMPPEKEYYKIVVMDNGIGFEPEYSQKIFKAFQRLHGNAEYPGSGIGLAICNRIMDIHKGVIFSESRVGVGSAFTLLFPQKE